MKIQKGYYKLFTGKQKTLTEVQFILKILKILIRYESNLRYSQN